MKDSCLVAIFRVAYRLTIPAVPRYGKHVNYGIAVEEFDQRLVFTESLFLIERKG
jgi:hypothetical protein